jgi:hypothetical protein
MIAQSVFDGMSWLIAAPQPDDFRRRTKEGRHIGEICVLRNENEIVCFRIFPDGSILSCSMPSKRI